MSSQRRIDSSRANGALSEGPITPQGQANSQAGPTTHGLASHRLVLESESEDEFRALRKSYLTELRPATPIEFRLFDQYVAACWRLDRISKIETALLDLEMTRQQAQIKKEFKVCDSDTHTALAFRALRDDLTAISRYEARYRRTCERALKILNALRENKDRTKNPVPKSNTKKRGLLAKPNATNRLQ
jgi:hypothetical protein